MKPNGVSNIKKNFYLKKTSVNTVYKLLMENILVKLIYKIYFFLDNIRMRLIK
ncbi:hypothetical protein FB1_20060 [Flavobacterium branchiophilum NBRC 15030 = ATCC 35035]|nr:hypothetical protein FB1_20060 [Flavobacterium branchiophilum NBRC 15030 = ATCC 35035]